MPLRTGALGEVPAGASGPAAVSLTPALAARDWFRELYGNRARRSVLPLRTGALLAGGSPAGLHHRVTRHGPHYASPHGGSLCVGARDVLVAYNLWLAVDDVALAREIARSMRRTEVEDYQPRVSGGKAQVSCNLVEPWQYGPAEAFDFVSRRAPVARAELVGLVPTLILAATPRQRWSELDLAEDRTIEARLLERAVTL